MNAQLPQDPLVGLAINPGDYKTELPSADELRDLWPKWIRCLLSYKFQDVQSGQNSELDSMIDRYQDLGVNIFVLINNETFTETIPARGAAGWGDAQSGYIGRVSDLVQKITTYYRGKIHAIQVFNEPDIQGIRPEDYGELLTAAYSKVKAESDLPVISAGICCGESFEYLQRVVQSAQGAFDGVGWHAYAERVDGYPFSAWWGDGELRTSLARARSIGGKPLWITEIGAELGYTWRYGVTSADAVAEYMKLAYDLIRDLGANTVAHAFWFTWRSADADWGLVDNADNRRAAWYAFQQTTRLPPFPPLGITNVTFTPNALDAGQLLKVSITAKNNTDQPLTTQGPDPGFIYEEGESFYSRGFPEINGAFRVGVDFDGRNGLDHPYRWGLGAPLAPGQTTTISGAIRLKSAQAINYWAGSVSEQIAWLQDRRGVQPVTVNAPSGGTTTVYNVLQIVNVALTPTGLDTGQLLNVSITVKNNSNQLKHTQGPGPGFVYAEGESFQSRGFPDVNGAFRVGIDFDGRNGIDHPYRWGFGAPLSPGQMATITGAIRLETEQAKNYWAGLVQEQIAWLHDRQGTQRITVNPPVVT